MVVPGLTPVTVPEEEPTVATLEVDVVQIPHGVASDNVVVAPTHALVVPVIEATASLITREVLFHKSPASAVKLPLTALTTP